VTMRKFSNRSVADGFEFGIVNGTAELEGAIDSASLKLSSYLVPLSISDPKPSHNIFRH